MRVPTEIGYLDDKVALGVPGHLGEFMDQLPELRAAVCVYHPACRGSEGNTG